MTMLGPSLLYGTLNKYSLDEQTTVHWVNENTLLLQVESVSMASGDALLIANNRVQEWAQALAADLPIWVQNYVPAYTSLLIEHDLQLADKFKVLNWLRETKTVLTSAQANERAVRPIAKHYKIDVCYSEVLEDAFGNLKTAGSAMPNDLAEVSQLTSLAIADIIHLHTERTYQVFTVGFLPNFAYMGLTNNALTIPRLDTPRKRVPAGAVAIADNQTAIYPMASPGGWHILGYTPCKLGLNGDINFQAGDTVSFHAISEDAYYKSAYQDD